MGPRVGLMGGSFDPVHSAHVALAESALRHLPLDEVRWIPVGQAWQKARRLADANHRAAMVQAAIAHEPRFVLDLVEVQREGPSFTLDTVRALQAARPEASEWVLIIGLDQYLNLPSWQGWQELLQRVTLAVATREPFEPEPPQALRAFPHRMVHLPMAPQAVSSTEVRERLAGGESPESLAPGLIPVSVARYIANHQLYAPGAPR
ncbi:MAG: nicotinate (nicotinamide) nucleotide adenylyltransferase [Proteobacteria bacterium]|nr:nicotinate (nicotinamide) nucleotide adenylyltransferase [Pseudomonadota bacterium]